MSRHQEIIASYRVLGVKVGAPLEEVRRRYRRLMKRWHPDVSRESAGRAEEQSRKINEAFRRLRSVRPAEIQRVVSTYSRSPAGRKRPRPSRKTPKPSRKAPKPSRNTRNRRRPAAEDVEADGTRVKAHLSRRGRDMIGLVRVTRREAISGGHWEFKLRTCCSCGGWGAAAAADLLICSACGGLGVLPRLDASYAPCSRCGGLGRSSAMLCQVCEGTGEVIPFTVRCSVPPDTGQSHLSIFPGLGHPGIRGGGAGKLYLLLSVV